MPYGYLGTQPNQTVKNTGVLSVTDVAELQSQGKLGGSLELIEEQTVSSASALDFIDIKENVYDIHYLVGGFTQQSDNISIRLSNDNGISFLSSGYNWAQQEGQTGGIFGELKAGTPTHIGYFALAGTGANDSGNAYCYLYNLGNSAKYSFVTNLSIGWASTVGRMTFGGGVQPTAQIINAIRINPNSGTFSGTVKLYGVKQI
jgi:hypothetical protein